MSLFFLHSPTFFMSDNPTPRLLFCFIQQAVYKILTFNKIRDIAVLKKVRYAVCPMPYARRVPHVTEKGYNIKSSPLSQTKVSSPKPQTSFDNFYLKIEGKQYTLPR